MSEAPGGVGQVFPAVEPASVLYPVVQRLRELVAADPVLQRRPGEDLRAELLPRRRSNGAVELRRAYWSARRPDPASAWGITARTLYLDGRTGRVSTHDFPDDPAMDWLAGDGGALRGHGERAAVQVLRYIPLRRVTFRLTGGAGLPPRVIAKTKSAEGLRRAFLALSAAHAAAAAAGSDFAVPRPISLDVGRRLLYLEELPGNPLDSRLDDLGLEPAMRRLGELHREVHGLTVAGPPTLTVADWLDAAQAAATQIGILAPSVRAALDAVCGRLRAAVPADGELAFCQGDFVPGQILCAEQGWSVLDLDDGHLADPHSEVASLFTALARELPVPAGQVQGARQAYLAAYTARAGRWLDPERWRWFRTVAELRYLARRIVKGRAVPGEAAEVLDGLAAGPDRPET